VSDRDEEGGGGGGQRGPGEEKDINWGRSFSRPFQFVGQRVYFLWLGNPIISCKRLYRD